MGTVVIDRRILVDEADLLTDWSSPVRGESLALFSADPGPVEASDSIGMAVSEEFSDLVHTLAAATDLSDTLIYIWILANGTMDTTLNGGIAGILDDGTNEIGFHLAGSDTAAFRHEKGPVGWQCLLLDTTLLPFANTALAGATVSLDLANITAIGSMFTTLSKALGGAENCFTDIIRFGIDGINITDGTSGEPATFTEVAAIDRSTNTVTAYGAVRELGSGLFGCQSPFTIGDELANTYFESLNDTFSFEDRNIGTSRYFINIASNSTANTTTFKMGNKVGSTGGSDGSLITCPAGVGAAFDGSEANINEVLIYGSTLTGFENGLLFSANVTNAPNHEIFATVFSGCGQIDPGLIQFKNDSIIASTDINGAVLLDADGTGTWSELSYSGTVTGGYGIRITDTGTYDFNNITFTGFGPDANANAAVFNVSGGEVTLNILGGDSPTVNNSAGSTTIINNAVTVSIEGVTEGSACKIVANETVGTITIGDVILEELANISGIASTTLNYESAFNPSGLDVITRVRGSGLPNAALQDDNGSFTDETSNANSSTNDDMSLLPVVPVVNEDRYLFGHTEKFDSLKLELSTIGTGGFTITWQYWNGAWTNLTGVSDGTNSFSSSGLNIVSWIIPGDWATSTEGGLGPFFYVRAAYTAGSVTQVPQGRKVKLNTTRFRPFNQDRIITSDGLTVIATWIEDTIASF